MQTPRAGQTQPAQAGELLRTMDTASTAGHRLSRLGGRLRTPARYSDRSPDTEPGSHHSDCHRARPAQAYRPTRACIHPRGELWTGSFGPDRRPPSPRATSRFELQGGAVRDRWAGPRDRFDEMRGASGCVSRSKSLEPAKPNGESHVHREDRTNPRRPSR